MYHDHCEVLEVFRKENVENHDYVENQNILLVEPSECPLPAAFMNPEQIYNKLFTIYAPQYRDGFGTS